MSRTRREFLKVVAMAAVPIAASGIGCGDDEGAVGGGSGSGTGGGTGGGGGPVGDGGAECSAIMTTIGGNHGHTVDVTIGDVLAGVEKTYTFTGTHTHSITVTAAQFTTIAANGSVMVISTPGGVDDHTHLVTITCSAFL